MTISGATVSVFGCRCKVTKLYSHTQHCTDIYRAYFLPPTLSRRWHYIPDFGVTFQTLALLRYKHWHYYLPNVGTTFHIWALQASTQTQSLPLPCLKKGKGACHLFAAPKSKLPLSLPSNTNTDDAGNTSVRVWSMSMAFFTANPLMPFLPPMA